MRGKMITDSWFSTIECVYSWQRCVNRSKLEPIKYNKWRKKHVEWLLNLSFTVSKVRTFRNYQLCVYFSLRYVKICGICQNICLTRKLKFDDLWQIFAFLTTGSPSSLVTVNKTLRNGVNRRVCKPWREHKLPFSIAD